MREQLTSVGLDSVVDLRLGDAVELLQTLDGPFDFVLLDLWKELYVALRPPGAAARRGTR